MADAETGPADRPRVTLFAVGGTGESYAGDERSEVAGLLRAVTTHLDERFTCRWVGYPASYGPAPRLVGMSYRDSLEIGTRELRRRLREVDGPIALIGYSQGAVVIRDTLTELSDAGDPIVDRVLAVGLVADPHQPPGAVTGCAGWGVAGPGRPMPARVPTYWVGAPDDMICNATADSFVRDIADLTAALAFGGIGRWVSQLWTVLRTNSFQNASRTSPGFEQVRRDLGRMRTAMREIAGYLPGTLRWHSVAVRNPRGGRHTSYAREPYRRAPVTDPDTTGCQALARWLQVQATFSPVGCAGSALDTELAA
ncbi:PE-PPE domain-containing protein [Gordonia sp. PKS22-38]|uniref:PE-PPE domain-containing protein n=1 Tax=Gordonia prachuapensis TaxID=3115651 RepID=A0ABU7MQW6_9ACTN|nr:PE-PPE domain-containing protein [Gordonia sp. PKS22-38]